MAEYIGNEAAISLQRRLWTRRDMIGESPWLASGGRILVYVDPDAITWPGVRALAEEDGYLALTVLDRERMEFEVLRGLGATWHLDFWDVFLGEPAEVLKAAGSVVKATPLPDGWQLSSTLDPDADEIDDVQQLNLATGVSPNPAVSGAGAALTVMVRDGAGRLMASAFANMLFHPKSRLGGMVFVGLVSVAEKARGIGLGKLANARTLIDSHAAMGWTRATEFVAADNPASRAMVSACGLSADAGYLTGIASRGTERFTR